MENLKKYNSFVLGKSPRRFFCQLNTLTTGNPDNSLKLYLFIKI